MKNAINNTSFLNISQENPVVGWWSGGITSAVAIKLGIDIFGADKVKAIFIDTKNEHPDTYRFRDECARWFGIEIQTITGINDERNYTSIQDVWRRHKSLNVANGAICSTQLKKAVRLNWQKTNKFSHQIFGFEFNKKQFNRALSMTANNSDARPIYPLIMSGLDKSDCAEILRQSNIHLPEPYLQGFHNNNCSETGCVQGGIGYWQKIADEQPDKFSAMASMEHELTDAKGKPVTILKDQSKSSKGLVFLKPHPDYPAMKSLKDMSARPVLPLMECNGFCGTNDFNVNETQKELNLGE